MYEGQDRRLEERLEHTKTMQTNKTRNSIHRTFDHLQNIRFTLFRTNSTNGVITRVLMVLLGLAVDVLTIPKRSRKLSIVIHHSKSFARNLLLGFRTLPALTQSSFLVVATPEDLSYIALCLRFVFIIIMQVSNHYRFHGFGSWRKRKMMIGTGGHRRRCVDGFPAAAKPGAPITMSISWLLLAILVLICAVEGRESALIRSRPRSYQQLGINVFVPPRPPVRRVMPLAVLMRRVLSYEILHAVACSANEISMSIFI